jgi:Flp pilus assembly pilin Flp
MPFSRPQQRLTKDGKPEARPGLWRDRHAVTSIEYSLIALIIILGIVVGANSIGSQLGNTFNRVSSEL